MMNWFPAVGVTCSTSDGPMGNACAIMYTTGNTFLLPIIIAQANGNSANNGTIVDAILGTVFGANNGTNVTNNGDSEDERKETITLTKL